MQPMSSVITGLVEAATQQRPTGTEPSAPALSRSPDEARAWLAAHTPEEVDETIRHSLMSALGVELKTHHEWRFPENKPPYRVSTWAGVTAPSKANVDRAIARVTAMSTPPSREQAEDLIVQLQAGTARRANSDAIAEVGFDLYTHALMRHPFDVAREAVRGLVVEPKGGTAWFPTVAELEGECRRLGSDRAAILGGLQAWREPDPAAVQVARLESVWRELRLKATELSNKVGPGPATDEGPRGERIRLADAAVAEATAAREAWVTAREKTDTQG